MKRAAVLILTIALSSAALSSCGSNASQASQRTIKASDLMGSLMEEAEDYGSEVYDRTPRISEKTDSDFGEHVSSTYILYSGIYAVTYADPETDELLYIWIYADIPLLMGSGDGFEIYGFYAGALIRTLDNRSAERIVTDLAMSGLNIFDTFTETTDGANGTYAFALIGGKTFSLKYTPKVEGLNEQQTQEG